MTASQEAFQLAGYLAFAPLSPPIMRLVQEEMLPASATSHLAEVLLGGLVAGRRPADFPASHGDSAVSYEFHHGVREVLRSTVPRSAGLRVLRQVCRHITDHLSSPVNFTNLLESPSQEDLDALAQANRPFAEVARSALRSLGGRYAQIAEQLGRILEPLPASVPAVTSRGPGTIGPPAGYLRPAAAKRAASTSDFLASDGDPFRTIARPPFQGDDVSYPPSEGQGRGRRGEVPAIWIGVPPRNPYSAAGKTFSAIYVNGSQVKLRRSCHTLCTATGVSEKRTWRLNTYTDTRVRTISSAGFRRSSPPWCAPRSLTLPSA